MQGDETFAGVAVSGPATVDATTTSVTRTSPPDPTAARQVVKVETLLQHALSTAESVRPNGTDQMEMRVRLDGGHEDVTVRMQVVNDHMQVTFQTNSPELRKALEHGWEQFSADAAQTSTLAMSEPRFESPRINSAPQNGQADTPSFSSNQQNPRRQETAATFADELAPSVASRRAGLTTAATSTPNAGQSTARRWSGWA